MGIGRRRWGFWSMGEKIQDFALHRLYNAALRYYLLQETGEPSNNVYAQQVRSEMFAALLECQSLQVEPRWYGKGQVRSALTEETREILKWLDDSMLPIVVA